MKIVIIEAKDGTREIFHESEGKLEVLYLTEVDGEPDPSEEVIEVIDPCPPGHESQERVYYPYYDRSNHDPEYIDYCFERFEKDCSFSDLMEDKNWNESQRR
jgi:hypothetical protein